MFIERYISHLKKSGFETSEDFHDDYVDRVRTLRVNIDSKLLTFQFILYNDRNEDFDQFYQILDQDCCQIGFNSEKVFCSYSFIQSLNTGSMMNYHLMRESFISEQTDKRIEKYSSRGFELLYPKSFDFKNRKIVETEFVSEIYGSPFEENNDSLEIFSKGEKLIQNNCQK